MNKIDLSSDPRYVDTTARNLMIVGWVCIAAVLGVIVRVVVIAMTPNKPMTLGQYEIAVSVGLVAWIVGTLAMRRAEVIATTKFR